MNFTEIIWDLNSVLSVAGTNKPILVKICLIFNMLQADIHPKVGVKYNRTLSPLQGIYTQKK